MKWIKHCETVAKKYPDRFNDSLFLEGVKVQELGFVSKWIDLELPVDERSKDNRNAWHCYRFPNTKLRELLNASGVPKNNRESQFNCTPLWYLLREEYDTAAKDLIESGAFTEKDMCNGTEELDEIVRSEASLIRKVATRSKSSDLWKAKETLTRHAYKGDLDAIKARDLMEEFGASIVAERDHNSYTDPLFMSAVRFNNLFFVRNWIQLGLPVDELSRDNRNAWHCYQHVNPELREMLKAAAVCKFVAESQFGETPLWHLARNKRFSSVKDLVDSKTFTANDLPEKAEELAKIQKLLNDESITKMLWF